MSTRRIGSFLNLSPIQEISINPFSELNSDNINKITRSVSNCEDGVVFGLDVLNPNWYKDSLQHFDVFKSGQTTSQDQWQYDTEHCTAIRNGAGNISGFKIEDILKCSTQTISYNIKLSDLNLQNLKGKNVEAKFNLSFHIVSGCPKKAFAYVNQSNSCIEYPDNEPQEIITLPVIHNFLDDSDTLKISLMFVLDPTDTYTNHTIQETDYNGQSYLTIKNLKYEFDIVNLKDVEYRIKDNNLNGNYPSQYVHPTHILDITSGIAIKDDAVLNISGKNRKFIPALRLDLNDYRSWIRNNPYTLRDFTDNTAQQRGFIYNSTEPLELNEGDVNTETNELEFRYNGHTFIPSDEYVLTDNDCPLNFTFDPVDVLITIEDQTINTDIPECYGTVGYIYSKITNKVIKKIDLIYDKTTKHVDKLDIHLIQKDIKIDWSTVSHDTIGVVLSAGPVKVSGHKDEVCHKMINWANVVLYYTYLKNPRPNKAYIGLVRDTDLKDLRYREDYVILAKVRFISPNTVDIISYEDRQQIYHSVEKATNISYGSNLTPEEQALWIDPAGFECIPTSASDAITKLIRWIPQWIDKYSRVERSVTDNAYGLFEHNQIIKWMWDDEKERGDLLSSGYYINPNVEPYYIAAWNFELNTLTKTDFKIDPNSSLKPFSFTMWNEELDTLLSHRVNGIDGQIYFYDSEELIKPDWIMKNGKLDSEENDIIYVCNTTKDLQKCFDTIAGNGKETLYKRWIKFGHTSSLNRQWSDVDQHTNYPPFQYGIYQQYPVCPVDTNGNPTQTDGYGATAWFYLDELKSMIEPCNSYDYTGFVSDKKYADYDIIIRCFSPNKSFVYNGTTYSKSNDNDEMSFVAAFVTDDNGNQHTISFNRVGGDGSYWQCTLDRAAFRLSPTYNSYKVLANYSSCVSSEGNGQWVTKGDGALIHVKREGNKFTAWTSLRVNDGIYDKNDPDNSTIKELEISKIVLDIDNLTIQTGNDDPVTIVDESTINTLNLFKDKKVSFGYACCSQPISAFDLIKIPNDDRKVIDLVNNKVWCYNFADEKWVEINESVQTAFGNGKFSYNAITKKLFWQKEKEIIEINIQNEYPGNNGDVFYHKYNTDVEEMLQLIMNDNILLCQNQTEVDQCKNYTPNYDNMICTWRSFGHIDNKQFGRDDDYLNYTTRPGVYNWSNDDESIYQKVNTTDYVGFITRKSYNNYKITTKFWSNNGDDDLSAIVIAFATDKNGVEHTLSFCRQPAVADTTLIVPSRWCLLLDYKASLTNNVLLVNSASSIQNDEVGNWNELGEGVTISAQKLNNRISAKTSKFITNATEQDTKQLIEESLIDVSIDELIENNPDYAVILRLFKEKTQFGFSTMSQQNMHFKSSITLLNTPIYDIYSNKMYIHDGTDWILIDDKPSNHFNYGRLIYNELTDKLFWCNENGEYIQLLTSLNNLIENVKKIVNDGITEIEQKTEQAIETINQKIDSIISLPDYSTSLNITENGEYTINGNQFPRGAWINFQFNNFQGQDQTDKTIHIRGSKETGNVWHLVAYERGNRTTLDHSPIGNCGVIPIGVNDKIKITNLVFNGTSTNRADAIVIYGMM